MSNHKKLEDFRQEIDKCVKCGACQAQCAVYKTLKRESTVARGKVAIAEALLDKDLPLNDRFVLDMSQCLLCGSCYDKCPNLVPTDEIVMAARREIAERQGLTTFGKVLTGVIKRPKLMETLVKGGQFFGPFLFKKIPDHSGLRLRFPVPFISQDRAIPEFSDQPFRSRYPELIPGDDDKPLVAFFTGCMINYTYPEVGEALVKVMRFMGFPLQIPQAQGCCGLPALAAGDEETVDLLADANVDAFAADKAEVVVTACASCHAGIGKHYRDMGGDYAVLGDKVVDVLKFLVDNGLVEKLQQLNHKDYKGETLRVTYHDPCHLRTQGITAEPRALLRALPGVEFVEMEGADRCCGLGGTFSVYHYDTSRKIGSRKADGIAASQADVVASACPGCMMQLQDSIQHAGLPQRVSHVLQLIAECLPE
ncbi:MAG: (Fe-S)-binding protein [Desulfuromonas sp.]|nr:(Fe-S)-binding protein [Desulfuromonas sp.]